MSLPGWFLRGRTEGQQTMRGHGRQSEKTHGMVKEVKWHVGFDELALGVR